MYLSSPVRRAVSQTALASLAHSHLWWIRMSLER